MVCYQINADGAGTGLGGNIFNELKFIGTQLSHCGYSPLAIGGISYF